jgi:vacuolar-type H+-ATPase subunit I/STV1
MGTMPAVNIERLQSSLNHMPAVLVTLRRDALTATVLLIGTQRDADVINRAARSAYLNPLKLPETYSGTPAEAIVALQAEIGRVQQHAAEHRADIERLQETHLDHLCRLLWRVRTSRKLAETISRYGRLRFTYLVSGWVPTSIVLALRQEVRKFSDKIVFEARKAYRYTEPNLVTWDMGCC